MSKSIVWCFSLLILTLTACAPLQIVSTPSLLPTPTLDNFGPVVLTSLNCVTDLELDEQKVYWASCGEKGAIGSVSKNGGEALFLAQDDNAITSLAVDETAVYWTSCGEGKPTSTGAVMRMPKAGGTPETLFDGATCPSSLRVDGTNLYWIDAGLWTMDKAGSDPINIQADAELRMPERQGHERMIVRVVDIVKVEAGNIYYLVYVDNQPGMTACKDQDTTLMRVSKDGTTQVGIAGIDGPVGQYTSDKDATYLSGPCIWADKVIRVFDSGEKAAISLKSLRGLIWSRDMRAADDSYFYWWDDENNQLRRFPKQSAP